MKKTTRLTALLLALVLLLGTLSASATEAGIPIEDFDFGTYSSIRTTAEEGGAPDVTDCANCPEYCERVTYMLEECQTAQERYEYLMTLYVPEGEEATAEEADLILEYTLLHYYFCHLENPDDYSSYAVCVCDFPMAQPEKYQPGELSAHTEADCPWKFENMPVEEQYSKICLLSTEAQAPYLATLSTEQAAAFAAYSDEMLGEDLTDPCGPDNTYCQYITNELPNMTASEIYDELNALYYEGLAEGEEGPSSEYVALMLHYGYYHTSSNLICTCGEHPLPLPEYEIGDISVHEETCPWHFANLTTPEQYSVICLLDEDKEVSYKATLKAPQYAALAVYTDAVENESGCGDTCEYADVVAMNGYDRYWYIKQLYDETVREGGYPSEEYITLYAHLRNDHIDDGLICQCDGFDITSTDYAYGSTKHTGSSFLSVEVECPWHFNKLPVAEQSKVLNAVHPDLWAGYTETLTADQYAELMAYLGKVSDSTVENKTEIPKSETTGAEAEITVPAGAFEADYTMKAAETTLSDAEQAAVAEIGNLQVLVAYDISFGNVETGEEMQPTNGKVALTFKVETSKITGNELHVYHMQLNEDGTYTAELMGTIEVDWMKEVQEITVYADKFSPWVMAAEDCDGTGCYTDSATGEVISVKSIENMTPIMRYAKLVSLFGEDTTLEGLLLHFGIVHYDEISSLICTCAGADPLVYAPGAAGKHEDGCAWNASQMTSPSGKELLAAYATMTDVPHKAYFMSGMDASQKATLETELNGSADGVKNLVDKYGVDMANWMMDKRKITYEDGSYDYENNGISDWLLDQDEVEVSLEMIERAYQVEIELDSRTGEEWNFSALEALRLEGTELYSVYTGQAVADCDAETGAITDRSMGLIVGYADTENGTIIAPPSEETAGGDDTTNG